MEEPRKKIRQSDEKKDMINRLKRIEGQIRGIQKMIEEDRYCVDIFTQVSAIQSSLRSFNKVLLSRHVKTCVVEDIQNKETEAQAIDELCALLQSLMK